MPLPIVSLVTPAYNQADYLSQTIESVLVQSYPAIDYVVVDDGSTDATPAVLRDFGERVRWVRQENRGQAATLNAAWGRARGRYLAYLSSDDLIAPDAIARAVALLERDPGLVCAYPQGDLIGPRGETLKRSVFRPFDLADLVVRHETHIGPGAVFRADACAAVGGWPERLKLAPDRDFWVRLATHGRFGFVPDTLAFYRMHPSAISWAETSPERAREHLTMLDGWFADGVLPPELSARADEAYGRAHLAIARIALRIGRFGDAWREWRIACRRWPPLASAAEGWPLIRSAVGKPVRLALGMLAR
ncbi:MAG: glycosyltransferase [Sphingomonadaceae bacterium]|nr:glycosyltransferase [Sphingomonadaceae bacterium]